jgi:chromosome segregation protein
VAEEALARLDGDLQARRADVARLENEADSLRAREDELMARASEAEQRLRSLHGQLRPKEAELATLEERAAQLESRLASLRAELTQAASGHETAALALQRAEHEVQSIKASLEADLALDPVDLPPPAPPPAGLQGRVKALRAQLAAFGPVNARAPADLAAAAERQEFLETQATDLREGIARLRRLIADANATVRERFSTVAGELDAQFRLYVQQLFGGGRGELTALYDTEGLPSGLDIAVQPPGKKTRELALLSGGERALVGLALVFAMLAVRPVPFCVLDEAEATLDEANTLRVGDILRALSARTQFIVITHNRGTMSRADALYGVTMAESGISQVAGLRLEEVEAVRRRAG